jgi:hypothetical protein
MLDQKLMEAAESGDWSKVTLSKITKEMISETEKEYNRNIFHLASTSWQLDKIPKELWDNNLLLAPDKSSSTVLHLATTREQLHLIPKELLTEKNLLKCNSSGWNTLAYISSHYPLSILPNEILTEKNLTHRSSCCLTLVIRSLQLSRDDKFKELLNNNINIILSKLSKERIEKIVKNCQDDEIKPQMKEYTQKELRKRNLMEQVNQTNCIQL